MKIERDKFRRKKSDRYVCMFLYVVSTQLDVLNKSFKFAFFSALCFLSINGEGCDDDNSHLNKATLDSRLCPRFYTARYRALNQLQRPACRHC